MDTAAFESSKMRFPLPLSVMDIDHAVHKFIHRSVVLKKVGVTQSASDPNAKTYSYKVYETNSNIPLKMIKWSGWKLSSFLFSTKTSPWFSPWSTGWCSEASNCRPRRHRRCRHQTGVVGYSYDRVPTQPWGGTHCFKRATVMCWFKRIVRKVRRPGGKEEVENLLGDF